MPAHLPAGSAPSPAEAGPSQAWVDGSAAGRHCTIFLGGIVSYCIQGGLFAGEEQGFFH